MEFATGADLIKNAVRAAVGDEITPLSDPNYDGYWAEIILHADKDGKFKELRLDNEVKNYVYETDLWVEAGEEVHAFTAANFAIGTLVLRFDTKEKMNEIVDTIYNHIEVVC